MPQRDDELPEGTDHIINGAMETNGGGAGGGGSSSGFIGAAGGDGTGGTAMGGGTNMSEDSGNEGGGVVEQLRGHATALRDQAGDRVREFAEGGKTRASDALDEISRPVGDTAET